MAAASSLGFMAFYGLSPSINFFEESKIDVVEDTGPINVLLSQVGDIRHILKSISDVVPLTKKKKVKGKMKPQPCGPRKHPINIYLHDTNYEVLGRALLLLTLICETSMSKRERMELFLDLYGNALIRDKTDTYLQGVVNELIQLVTEDDRCPSVLKEMISFEDLKYKERDELEDVISSYHAAHKFDIEKYRDDR